VAPHPAKAKLSQGIFLVLHGIPGNTENKNADLMPDAVLPISFKSQPPCSPGPMPLMAIGRRRAWVRMIESEIDRGIFASRVEAEYFLDRLVWYLKNTQAATVQVGRMTFFL
jgi:hypothetical protein